MISIIVALAFPPRAEEAETGSEFAARIAPLGDHARYDAARDAILAGNVPDFLRDLVPVTIEGEDDDGVPHEVTLFVTPEYLAVGCDDDYVQMPLDFVTAAEIARRTGFALPTPRIVDAIYDEASLQLEPVPLPPGPQMRSMAYVLEHQERIAVERDEVLDTGGVEWTPGELVAGTNKDVVITKELRARPGQEAIYGWHRTDGKPIQGLSLFHGSTYADYSHGIRLIASTVLVDGEPLSYFAALANPVIGPLLSYEGPIYRADRLLRPLLPR
jgi:hypothetical protein